MHEESVSGERAALNLSNARFAGRLHAPAACRGKTGVHEQRGGRLARAGAVRPRCRACGGRRARARPPPPSPERTSAGRERSTAVSCVLRAVAASCRRAAMLAAQNGKRIAEDAEDGAPSLSNARQSVASSPTRAKPPACAAAHRSTKAVSVPPPLQRAAPSSRTTGRTPRCSRVDQGGE